MVDDLVVGDSVYPAWEGKILFVWIDVLIYFYEDILDYILDVFVTLVAYSLDISYEFLFIFIDYLSEYFRILLDPFYQIFLFHQELLRFID